MYWYKVKLNGPSTKTGDPEIHHFYPPKKQPVGFFQCTPDYGKTWKLVKMISGSISPWYLRKRILVAWQRSKSVYIHTGLRADYDKINSQCASLHYREMTDIEREPVAPPV